MKKLVYGSIAAFALLLTGCGGGSDSASCRFEVQQNLDKGNFDAVIAELDNPSSECRAAYVGNEWKIDLGAAYMGQAGLGVSDIIGLIGVEDGTGVTYETFINKVSAKQTDTALTSLGDAGDSYLAALGAATCADPLLTTSEKDLCLYIGLADTMLATTTISYLVPDIAALFDTTDITAQDAAKEEMKASMCALAFMFDGSICTDATSVVASDVIFSYSDSTTKTFSDITVTMAAPSTGVYHRLGLSPLNTTVVTDGYCMNDFTNPSTTWDLALSPYACPLNQDPTQEDLNISTLLVDTLNGGLDSVSGALSSDPALQADIDTYKAEIDTNSDGITIDEIQAYLLTL